MILPDKHVMLAESILGLGAVVLDELSRPLTIEQLHNRILAASGSRRLPAYHGFNSVMLTLLFLYAIGAVELTQRGIVRRCD